MKHPVHLLPLLAAMSLLAAGAPAADMARVRVVNTGLRPITFEDEAIAPGASREVRVPADEKGTLAVIPPAGYRLKAAPEYPSLRPGSLYTLRVLLVESEEATPEADPAREPEAPSGEVSGLPDDPPPAPMAPGNDKLGSVSPSDSHEEMSSGAWLKDAISSVREDAPEQAADAGEQPALPEVVPEQAPPEAGEPPALPEVVPEQAPEAGEPPALPEAAPEQAPPEAGEQPALPEVVPEQTADAGDPSALPEAAPELPASVDSATPDESDPPSAAPAPDSAIEPAREEPASLAPEASAAPAPLEPPVEPESVPDPPAAEPVLVPVEPAPETPAVTPRRPRRTSPRLYPAVRPLDIPSAPEAATP